MSGGQKDLRRTAVSLLLACAALLPLYWVDPRSLAQLDLFLTLAPFTLPLSASAGVVGAGCVAALLIVLRVIRRGLTPLRRVTEFLICAVVIALVLGGGAYINEHFVKPAVEAPRPNLILLAETPSPESPLLGMTVEAFYALGDKAGRRAYLSEVLSSPAFEARLSLPSGMKRHWLRETGFSFPSGHSYAAMLIAAYFLSLGFNRKPPWQPWLGLALPLWAALVVGSRVLLLVHSADDVLFGSLLGILVGCSAGAGTRRLLCRISRAG